MSTRSQKEQAYPYAIAVLSGCAVFYILQYKGVCVPPTTNTVLQAIINVAAISVGFLATAKSILLSVGDKSSSIKWLKDAGAYKLLLRYFMEAVWLCLLLTVFSTIALLIEPGNSLPGRLIISVWSVVAVASALACYRIIDLFSRILRMDA